MKVEIYMAFCKNCGNPLNDNSVFCSNCGAQITADNNAPQNEVPQQNYPQDNMNYQPYPVQNPYQQGYYGAQPPMQQPMVDDTPSTGLKVLSFFIPLVGLILFCVQNSDKPVSAKAYGKWALIGFITSIVLSILSTACTMLFFGSIASTVVSSGVYY